MGFAGKQNGEVETYAYPSNVVNPGAGEQVPRTKGRSLIVKQATGEECRQGNPPSHVGTF